MHTGTGTGLMLSITLHVAIPLFDCTLLLLINLLRLRTSFFLAALASLYMYEYDTQRLCLMLRKVVPVPALGYPRYQASRPVEYRLQNEQKNGK